MNFTPRKVKCRTRRPTLLLPQPILPSEKPTQSRGTTIPLRPSAIATDRLRSRVLDPNGRFSRVGEFFNVSAPLWRLTETEPARQAQSNVAEKPEPSCASKRRSPPDHRPTEHAMPYVSSVNPLDSERQRHLPGIHQKRSRGRIPKAPRPGMDSRAFNAEEKAMRAADNRAFYCAATVANRLFHVRQLH